MKVFLLKDIERIGLLGEIINISEGYARNYLIPRKLAVEITPENEEQFKNRVKVIKNRKEAVATKTSMLAERIKSTQIILSKKIHDDGKLYGSVMPQEIVEALKEKGISVSKSQILFGKSIKKTGLHEVTIKLSSSLMPNIKVKVVSVK